MLKFNIQLSSQYPQFGIWEFINAQKSDHDGNSKCAHVEGTLDRLDIRPGQGVDFCLWEFEVKEGELVELRDLDQGRCQPASSLM